MAIDLQKVDLIILDEAVSGQFTVLAQSTARYKISGEVEANLEEISFGSVETLDNSFVLWRAGYGHKSFVHA